MKGSKKVRRVVVSAQTLLEIFKDYLTESYVPADARIVSLMHSKKEKGKLMIVAESDDWQRGMPPLMVRFDIRRTFSVNPAGGE